MKPEKPKQKIIHRIFRFFFKLAVALALITYVFFGMGTTIQLVKINSNKKQDIGALNEVIDQAVRNGEPHAATSWVRLRPLTETDIIIDIVTPKSADLEPGMFFELFRRQISLDNTEDALFWEQLARFRLRYDAIRCQVPDGYKSLEGVLNFFESDKIIKMLKNDPKIQEKSLREVLDFDEKYPAHNNPAFTCDIIRKSSGIIAQQMPEKDWNRERLSMRRAAEIFLKTPDKK
jgi:hypothetical protein